MRRGVEILLLGASAVLAGELPGWRPDEPVERRCCIPSEANRHGEVRVIRRGEAECVQTLLCSPMLARGLKAIRGKEMGNWPEGAPGHADSTNYIALLREAEVIVREEFEQRADKSDLRQRMLIEFVCDEQAAHVAVYAVEIQESNQAWRVTSARLLGQRPLSRAYARRDMDLMIENAFHPPPAEDPLNNS